MWRQLECKEVRRDTENVSERISELKECDNRKNCLRLASCLVAPNPQLMLFLHVFTCDHVHLILALKCMCITVTTVFKKGNLGDGGKAEALQMSV